MILVGFCGMCLLDTGAQQNDICMTWCLSVIVQGIGLLASIEQSGGFVLLVVFATTSLCPAMVSGYFPIPVSCCCAIH